jgi:hypothetical protein
LDRESLQYALRLRRQDAKTASCAAMDGTMGSILRDRERCRRPDGRSRSRNSITVALVETFRATHLRMLRLRRKRPAHAPSDGAHPDRPGRSQRCDQKGALPRFNRTLRATAKDTRQGHNHHHACCRTFHTRRHLCKTCLASKAVNVSLVCNPSRMPHKRSGIEVMPVEMCLILMRIVRRACPLY